MSTQWLSRAAAAAATFTALSPHSQPGVYP
jgi:hypothetical protein